jgi:hypothetical protein
MTVSIEHSLKFVTEFDENHPIAKQALSMPQSDLIVILEGMLKDLLVPALLPEINKINENGSYAILKVVA